MFENIYRYQRFEDFKITLQEIARAFPELVKLETIGTSFRGREVFLVKVTDFSKGMEEDKNAFYADACTHAEEFSGCNALLSLIKQLAEGFEKDEIIRDLLSHTVFYLIPRLNPDGIEFAMEGHPWCGNGRYLPSESQPLDGFYWEDLDDNGIIANMRVEDPDGEWKISEKEPRLMTLRSPGEHGGKYYRLYPEGRIRGKVEGAPLPKPRDGNLNRNYPSLWTPEGMQYGAGDLPLSEPETRAVADFMVTHKNIAMVLSLHTNAGVILRPFGHQSDSHYKGRDLHIFEELGKMGTEILDYPVVSVFEEFTPESEAVRGGTLTDWTYFTKGIPSLVVEQWNVGKESDCGITSPYPPDYLGEDAEIRVLRWAEEHLKDRAYVDWKEYDHPELGKVEIGGFNRIRVFRNPPEDYLKDLSDRTARYAIRLASCLPELEIRDVKVTNVERSIYKIEAVARNKGYLPTYLSSQSREVGNCEDLKVFLDGDCEIICATDEKTIPHLEGRFGRESEWSQWIFPWEPNEKKVEWVIRSASDNMLTLTIGNSRCGFTRKEIHIE